MGYEIIIILSTGQKVVVFAKTLEEYSNFMEHFHTENTRRHENYQALHQHVDGRVMKRGPRNAITTEQFHNAYF